MNFSFTPDMDVDSNDSNNSNVSNVNGTRDANNNFLIVDGNGSNAKRLIASNGGRCMSTQAMQSLYDLRQNNVLCDAVLRLEDGGVFPIHRAILSACSNYFRYLPHLSLLIFFRICISNKHIHSSLICNKNKGLCSQRRCTLASGRIFFCQV